MFYAMMMEEITNRWVEVISSMFEKINKADSLFLISDECFQNFQHLIRELDLFTLILPFDNNSYQRTVSILDIWYSISNEENEQIISHPENAMIYPYRSYLLKIIKQFQIKRYIQLALYENERLAFICAIYLYNELDKFISMKMLQNRDIENDYKMFQTYNEKSMRQYYDLKYIELENYPKQLARLQSSLVTELQHIHHSYDKPVTWVLNHAIDEASHIYEAVFGLINDWGGRVS
jgi:hypothetical protein